MALNGTERILVGVLTALAVAGLADGVQVYRAARSNRLIEAGQAATLADATSSELRFARAHELTRQGEHQAALAAYRALEADAPPGLATAARYNSGNILLRLAVDAGTPEAQRIPLVELAKETYREVLRAQPEHWDARFNLERAQRLLPDPETGEDTGGEPPLGAERAATTMRGYTPGLP